MQKVSGKMIFTWSFWAFHDISSLGNIAFCAVTVIVSSNFLSIKKTVASVMYWMTLFDAALKVSVAVFIASSIAYTALLRRF